MPVSDVAVFRMSGQLPFELVVSHFSKSRPLLRWSSNSLLTLSHFHLSWVETHHWVSGNFEDPAPRIFRSNGSLDRDTITTCPLRTLLGGFTSMLRTCPRLTSNCLRPPSACSIVNNFRRKLLLLTKRKMMNPAIARRITRATVAGTAGRIMPIAPTRKCALKLNCPPPLFTIILSVVTYTVDPLGSPPARKYPITLSFGDVNTGPRLG